MVLYCNNLYHYNLAWFSLNFKKTMSQNFTLALCTLFNQLFLWLIWTLPLYNKLFDYYFNNGNFNKMYSILPYSEWSSDGCWLVSHNRSHSLCNCNHLTSFALLMDINSSKAQVVVDQLSHRNIVYIGAIIALSVIALTLIALFIAR